MSKQRQDFRIKQNFEQSDAHDCTTKIETVLKAVSNMLRQENLFKELQDNYNDRIAKIEQEWLFEFEFV